MLQNFFSLDEPFEECQEEQLVNRFVGGADLLQNILYRPDVWPQRLSKVKEKSFKNVSLSKKTLSKVTFTKCKFVDCLFIGTKFINVEFHNCEFSDCNFHKVDFQDCYIDPDTVKFSNIYKATAANIGVHTYQKLLDNSTRARQQLFERSADIRFRQWKRAQLRYDYQSGKISWRQKLAREASSVTYELLCGFGYRPINFMCSTVVLFLAVSVANLFFLQGSLSVDGVKVDRFSLVDSIFYSFSMLTSLGFSTVIPVTPGAKIAAVVHSLMGIGWLGVFTSLLVKRFIK